jgi:hypothetical protein
MRATCPTHLIFLDIITRIIFVEECKSWRSSICSFLQSPVTSSEAHLSYSALYSRIPSSYVTPLILRDRVSNPYAVTGKIMICYI